jgi:hypothetical protein
VYWLGSTDPQLDRTAAIICAPGGDPGRWETTTPLGDGWWVGVDPM